MKRSSTEMLKWMELASKMNEEKTPEEERAAERAKAVSKLHGDLNKTNRELMKMKADKLNMLIRKKYYDSAPADADVDEGDLFQFHFSETKNGWEFHMPLNILFGKRTQAFCAQYWDDFFKQAGIDVQFANNIGDALQKAGNINLVMTIDADMEEEDDDENDGDDQEETEQFDIEGSDEDENDTEGVGSDEEWADDEFDLSSFSK